MSRLIDADEVVARIDTKLNEVPTFTESEYGIMGYSNACVAIKRMLDSLPTVKTSGELIRCKDCEYSGMVDFSRMGRRLETLMCEIWDSEVDDNDYCSRAERVEQ